MSAYAEKLCRIPQAAVHAHVDRGGVYTCSDLLVPRPDMDDRFCYTCGRKEYYDPKQFYIIARQGVTPERLKNLCEKFFGVILMDSIIQDANSSKTFAAIVTAVGGEEVKDPESLLLKLPGNSGDFRRQYDETVWAICSRMRVTYIMLPAQPRS